MGRPYRGPVGRPEASPREEALPGLDYQSGPGYDELIDPSGRPRPAAAGLWQHLSSLTPDALAARQRAADDEIRRIGVTFHASDGVGDTERPGPST